MANVFSFDQALVRSPASTVTQGLRAVDVGAPSYQGVLGEHAAYIEALRAAGVEVEILEPLPEFPDSLFVEDPALTFTEGAILLHPGAPSRAGETALIEPVLRRRFKTVLRIAAGFADGGDVLTLPDRVMIGLSARTDRMGAEALKACLEQLGRKAEIAETPAGVLHFKSDCSLLDDHTILSTARLARSGVFGAMRVILTPPGEDAAANALRVNDRLLVGAGYAKTVALLRREGYAVTPLETKEIAKIDAGLSCMSLRWRR